ncbi:unnamed protein product [Rotaria sp. Silwood2]|nr:unnamed protein product [Rotaria sp. Silwood2]
MADEDLISDAEENSFMSFFTSFGIHILMIIIVIILKWQYERNRYRYPKGPRDWRHITDAISRFVWTDETTGIGRLRGDQGKGNDNFFYDPTD